MPAKDVPELSALQKELDELYKNLKKEQDKQADTTLQDVCANMEGIPRIRPITRKLLKGHLNKVNSVHYSGDNRHCVSGSLDGKLIIWDTYSGNKMQIIPLRSAWVMSVAFAPSGNFVACGGMDNMCTVYDINARDNDSGSAKLVRELAGYDGFLSSCRFFDDRTLLTGSGDMKICKWDLETGQKSADIIAHNGDVVSISIAPEGTTFVTGSVDKTCRLWDVREDNRPKQTFFGHQADVNSVFFHPSGQAFVTASEDKSARLYDIRSDQQVALYKPPNSTSGFTSCALSLSGRVLFCGSDDNQVHMWDTLKEQHNGILTGHENRVTSLAISSDGVAFVTSSWDMQLRVWG